jgi:hypothetical protein
VRYCRVHGRYSDSEDGCPHCRYAEESAQGKLWEITEKLEDLSRRARDFGDYVCPHCRYKTLRLNASRCPQCHGDPGSGFWARIEANELEKRRKEAEAAEKLRQRKGAEDAAWVRNTAVFFYFVYLLPILTIGTVALKEHKALDITDRFLLLAPGLNLLALFAFLVNAPDFMLLTWKAALAWSLLGVVLSVLFRKRQRSA